MIETFERTGRAPVDWDSARSPTRAESLNTCAVAGWLAGYRKGPVTS